MTPIEYPLLDSWQSPEASRREAWPSLAFVLKIGVFLSTVTLGTISLAQDESRLSDQFYAEGPSAWTDLESSFRNIEATGTETVIKRVRGAVKHESSTRRNVIIRHGELRRLTKQQLKENNEYAEVVLAANSKYAFRLGRAAGAPRFQVAYFGTRTKEFDDELEEGTMRYLSAPWTLLNWKRLRDLTSEPGFNATRILPIYSDVDTLVRVEFDYAPEDAGEAGLRGGYVVMCPNDLWAVREFDCQLTWGKITGTVVYARQVSGLPTLAYVTRRYQTSDEEHETEMRFEFDTFIRREADASDFTLAAFGLPELTLPTSGRHASRAAFALYGIAAITGCLALVFGLLAHRQQRGKLAPLKCDAPSNQ